MRRIKLNYQFQRDEIARYISNVITGALPVTSENIPYRKSNNHDNEWTLDPGNNWWLTFINDNIIEIRYRYQCESNNHEVALTEWLKIILKAEDAS